MAVSDNQPISVGDLKYLVQNGLGGGSHSMTAATAPAEQGR